MGLTNKQLGDSVRYSGFGTDSGCEEFFLAVRTKPDIVLAAGIKEIEDGYASALDHAGLSDENAVFSRLFVSDFANQKEQLGSSALMKRLKSGALSIIEEKPVGGGLLSLFSYHLRNRKYPAGASESRHAADDYCNTNLYKGKNYSLFVDRELFE